MSSMAQPRTVRVGDDVQYTKLFLRSIGATEADPLWHARGQVVGLTTRGVSGDFTLARVMWDNPDVPERMNAFNIAPIGSPRVRVNPTSAGAPYPKPVGYNLAMSRPCVVQ